MSAARVLDFVWGSSSPMPAPPVKTAAVKTVVTKEKTGRDATPIESLAFYRKHTEKLLRQYMHTSMEMGRVPSILGNCIFRGKVSSYRLRSFEDGVIFVFDIEKCLKRLDKYSQDLVGRIALQEYTQGETATLINQPLRSVARRYTEALDILTAMLLEYELLTVEGRRNRNPSKANDSERNTNPKKSCQGGVFR
jgi:hypothetical protein